MAEQADARDLEPPANLVRRPFAGAWTTERTPQLAGLGGRCARVVGDVRDRIPQEHARGRTEARPHPVSAISPRLIPRPSTRRIPVLGRGRLWSTGKCSPRGDRPGHDQGASSLSVLAQTVPLPSCGVQNTPFRSSHLLRQPFALEVYRPQAHDSGRSQAQRPDSSWLTLRRRVWAEDGQWEPISSLPVGLTLPAPTLWPRGARREPGEDATAAG